MSWPLKVGDFVEVRESFFADKVGKIGRVSNIRPEAEHPYEVIVDRSGSVFTRDALSDPISVEKIISRLNLATDRIAELEKAQDPAECFAPKP